LVGKNTKTDEELLTPGSAYGRLKKQDSGTTKRILRKDFQGGGKWEPSKGQEKLPKTPPIGKKDTRGKTKKRGGRSGARTKRTGPKAGRNRKSKKNCDKKLMLTNKGQSCGGKTTENGPPQGGDSNKKALDKIPLN